MGFAFRYLPFNSHFQERELEYSSSLLEKVASWYNHLGFSKRSYPLPNEVLFSSTSAGDGLRGLVNPGDTCVSNILVEVLTAMSGSFGRYLALISWGVGCTIWYTVEPCSMGLTPDSSLFGPLFLGDSIYNMGVGYKPPGFKVLQLTQNHDVTYTVESAFQEKPFSDFKISGNSVVQNSVKLGVLLTFALATGQVP